MTTAVGPSLPKYLRVAAVIRRQIADGDLRPGQPAPSGAELSRAFGFSTLTCRKALRALITEGLLVPGPSPNARPRVADPRAPDRERDLADAARALSAGLAGRRHAAGLTQAELAALTGVSVTTVGHAETGRTWQSRRFWERADTALRAAGDLLRLHDAFRAASSPHQGQRSTPGSIERTVSSTRPAHPPGILPAPLAPPFPITPTQAAPVQARPDQAASTQPGSVAAGSAEAGSLWAGVPQGAFGEADIAELGPLQVNAARADAAEAGPAQGGPFRVGPAPVGPPPVGPPPVGPAPVGPSRIVIVWTDGTVTTVHAPEILTAPTEATFPDLER